MVKYLMVFGALVGALSVAAQKDEDIKADSVVYDKPTEWRVYAADEPVNTFTLTPTEIWYATASSVFSASIKMGTVKKFAQLEALPATDVVAMATDAHGAIWIGGKNGLAQYHAGKFTTFTSKNGLPDNAVNALYAQGGSVWVGTDKGLAQYTEGSWKVYTTQNGLSNDKVQALDGDSDGAVWVGTAKGVSVFNGSSWTLYTMKNGMSWNSVKALAVNKRKGTVWAAVGDKDVNSFTKGTWSTYLEIQEGITSIMIDTQNRVWFGSSEGLFKYNGDEWVMDAKQLGIPAAKVQWMQRDAEGNLYFAMESGIVRLVNPYPF